MLKVCFLFRVNFQKYMPGFDHLKNSEVYRLVHGLED